VHNPQQELVESFGFRRRVVVQQPQPLDGSFVMPAAVRPPGQQLQARRDRGPHPAGRIDLRHPSLAEPVGCHGNGPIGAAEVDGDDTVDATDLVGESVEHLGQPLGTVTADHDRRDDVPGVPGAR
jgi:hypothetical protein